MRNAIDYTSRLLIVEAPDSDWNMTAYPMISVDREIGCQRWVGWSETCEVEHIQYPPDPGALPNNPVVAFLISAPVM